MPGITVMTEVKSCPFCSSEKIKVEQKEQENGVKVWVCWCGNCGALGPVHLNWSGAIAMWNLRRSQKALVDALKKIARILSKRQGLDWDYRSQDEHDIHEIAKQALAQVKGDQS